MKVFKKGDIIYAVIKAHPKVEFFANGGQVHYNRQNYPADSSNIPIDSIGLFDLVNKVYAGPPVIVNEDIDNVLLAENGDYLITEDGDYISLE